MRRTERDEQPLPLSDAPTTASIYCLAAMVADEASHAGFRDFAKAIEAGIIPKHLNTIAGTWGAM